MNIIAMERQGHYSDMIAACEKNNWSLIQLEKQSYGMTHTEVGKKAALHWKLPEIYQPLMEISPNSAPETIVEDLAKLTFIAAVCGIAAAGDSRERQRGRCGAQFLSAARWRGRCHRQTRVSRGDRKTENAPVRSAGNGLKRIGQACKRYS
jgi:hypothetical protein